MAVIPQQRDRQWKEQAIIRSEVVTDTWDVTKAWAGRFAEWVLFLCMIANIVQILPGVQLSGWFSNMVLGFQAVTLDVAGFGLATLAEHARVNGDTHTARTAQRTAYLLIGIMLVTVLSVALGDLWPFLKGYTDSADRGLILVRVGMTVVYGHVVHGLRRHVPSQNTAAAASISVLERWEARLGALAVQQDATTQAIARVMETVQQVRTEVSTLESELHTTFPDLVQRVMAERVSQVQHEFIEHLSTLLPRSSFAPEEHNVQTPEPLNPEPVPSRTTDIGSKVQRFISNELEQGHTPTLEEIMTVTGCSKGSASRYRALAIKEHTA